MALPAWLGPLIELSDFHGDTQAYIEKLYAIFHADFVASAATFSGKHIVFDSRKIDKGKEECFWHITSSDNQAHGRLPDMRRCERIGWIKPIIDNHVDPAIRTWENVRGRKLRTNLFIEDGDFLVILQNDKRHFVLITAIYIDYPNRKKRLLAEYEAYVRNGKKPV